MNDFGYSDGALNVYSLFHNAEKMLYVEGDDDRAFWDVIFNKFGVSNIEIQEVGGDEELRKMIKKINDNEVDAIAAKDVDFSILDEDYQVTDKVITTYGHSIENSLVCPVILRKVIRSHGRVALNAEEQSKCIEWLDEFLDSFNSLIVYDAINEITKSGKSILFNNCSGFMKTRLSPFPCDNKIENHIASRNLDADFMQHFEEVEQKIEGTDRAVSDFMRGHFLFSAAIRFVNSMILSKGSNKSASNDAFYSGAILAFESVLNEHHPHYLHYQNEINRVIN